MDWDEDQQEALDRISYWFEGCEAAGRPRGCNSEECVGGQGYWHTHGTVKPAPVLALGGLAGSGKTTLVKALESELGVRAVYGTPTHKAASVLRRKMDDPEQAGRVRTYHSMIYTASETHRCSRSGLRVREDRTARCGHGERSADCLDCPPVFVQCGEHRGLDCRIEGQLHFDLREHVAGVRRLIVVDEASMLTEEQVDHIRSFGIPVLLCGDHGQLPPVQGVMNRGMLNPEIRLEGNHRQADGAEGIVDTARAVRAGGTRVRPGMHAPGLWAVDRRDAGVMDYFTLDGFAPGPDRAVIAWTNRMRSVVNNMFHGEGPVAAGDRVISLQGGHVLPVKRVDGRWEPMPTPVDGYNGMVGTVTEVRDFKAKTATLVVELDDPLTVARERDEDGGYVEPHRITHVLSVAALDQFGRDRQLPIDGKPRGSLLWDYAYAITAHKAQGSEYTDVIILDERPLDYQKWMYTALTRAKRRVIVVRW